LVLFGDVAPNQMMVLLSDAQWVTTPPTEGRELETKSGRRLTVLAKLET
jgi:hypothetical protein